MDILSYAMARSGASADIDSIIAQLPKGLVYKGAVDYYSNLPNNANVGDTYTVKYKDSSGSVPDGNEYAWGKYDNINQWILIGGSEVASVNGKTGAVVLNASDVGADPAGSSGTVASTLAQHVGDTNVHTTSADKARWNAKYDKPVGGIPDTDLNSRVTERLLPTKTSSDAGKVPVATENGVSWQNLPDNELFIITVERAYNYRTDVSYADARAAYDAGKTLLLKVMGWGDGSVDFATLYRVDNRALEFSYSWSAYGTGYFIFDSSGIREANSSAVRSVNGYTDEVRLHLRINNGFITIDSIDGTTSEVMAGMALFTIRYNDGGAMFAQIWTNAVQALASASNCHLRIASPSAYVIPYLYGGIFRQNGLTMGLAIGLDEDNTQILFGVPCGGGAISDLGTISLQFRGPVSQLGTNVVVSAVFTITADGVIYIDAEKISGYTDLGGKTISELTTELQAAFEALAYSDYAAMQENEKYTIDGYSWTCDNASSSNSRRLYGYPENVAYEVNVSLDPDNEAVNSVDILIID